MSTTTASGVNTLGTEHVLYISYDGMTDPLGQSQVLPYLIGLSRAGYRITLLSAEKPEESAQAELIERICKTAGIRWVPVPYTRRPPVVSTVNDVRMLRRTAARLHAETPFRMIHCRSYIPALVGQWASRKWKIPFLFDMRGFWADERVDGGLWPQTNILYRTIFRYFKRKEKEFFTSAAHIVSLTHTGKEEIESWKLEGLAPITVIPCCVDMELFDPAKVAASRTMGIRKQLGIAEGQYVVGYVGSIGTWYLLDEMLAFFRRLLQHRPDSILLFVTGHPAAMILQEALAAGIPEGAVKVTRAARKEMPDYIATMDSGLFFIKQSYSKKASSPVKQGELMAMGLPVICNSGVGDSDRIITDYQSGTLVHHFNDEAYDLAINAYDHTSFDRSAIRMGCSTYFALEQGIASYLNLYRKILN